MDLEELPNCKFGRAVVKGVDGSPIVKEETGVRRPLEDFIRKTLNKRKLDRKLEYLPLKKAIKPELPNSKQGRTESSDFSALGRELEFLVATESKSEPLQKSKPRTLQLTLPMSDRMEVESLKPQKLFPKRDGELNNEDDSGLLPSKKLQQKSPLFSAHKKMAPLFRGNTLPGSPAFDFFSEKPKKRGTGIFSMSDNEDEEDGEEGEEEGVEEEEPEPTFNFFQPKRPKLSLNLDLNNDDETTEVDPFDFLSHLEE